MSWKDYYEPPNPFNWTGKADNPNARFHQLVQCVDCRTNLPAENKQSFALIGFPMDEGVRRNQGRIGAAEGPQALRQALANIPNHRNDIVVYDVGDIGHETMHLERAQAALAEVVTRVKQRGCFPIILGGGHETAWGHFQGLMESADGSSPPAICNFDAHFDLRDLVDGQYGSSGTPFWQIYRYCHDRGLDFDYTCLGLQMTANTQFLFQRAEELGVHSVMAEDFHWGENTLPQEAITRLLELKRPFYATLCLDVFASSIAPGVSAPQPAGLYPAHIIPLLRQLAQSGFAEGFDVVELAPNYDGDHVTAKLAAIMVAEWLQHYRPRG